VEDAAATLTRLGEITSATGLRGIERSDWSPVWQVQPFEAAGQAAAALTALPDAVQGATSSLSLPAPPSPARPALAALDTLAGVLMEPIAAEAGWTLSESASGALDSIGAAAVPASRYRSAVPIARAGASMPAPSLASRRK